jgi:hypothetical protein
VRSISDDLSPLIIHEDICVSFSYLFNYSPCLSYNSTYLMQIVTDSVIDNASKVNYMLGNVNLPIDASRSSTLSAASVVNIANEFQIQSSCKSLII